MNRAIRILAATIIAACLAAMAAEAWAGLVFGSAARNQFEGFRDGSTADTFIDFNSLPGDTNLTTQFSGLGVTFSSNIYVDGTSFGPVHVHVSSFAGRTGTIVGSPCDGGCTDDGRVGYQVVFASPQRRAGLQRLWNQYTVTRFYNASNLLLAEHVNLLGSEFVGFIADGTDPQMDWVSRIQMDGLLNQGVRQVGYSDDLFFGSASTATTTTTSTTTTTASTTTTSLAGGITANLVQGWNLLGNGMSNTITVPSAFGDSSLLITVWKWIAVASRWAFYTPTLADGGAAYAASRGYDLLATINGGEGFWVYAKKAFSLQVSGSPVLTGRFADALSGNALPAGWSLIAVGDNPTPRAFANDIATDQPAIGTVAATSSVTTLWAWDPVLTTWYFYAPSLDNSGGLAPYITSKFYLPFDTRSLDPIMGFWVNHP